MKALNDGKQMRSDWHIPLSRGLERIMINGRKAHSTQKPQELLYRVIMASSRPGDLVLDPFLGTGTTAEVAKKLARNYVGIELEPAYVEIARQRIEAAPAFAGDRELLITPSKRTEAKVPFGKLLEAGLIASGETLYSKDRGRSAVVRADGQLQDGARIASIHQMGAMMEMLPACNGWQYWYVERDRVLVSIDVLREQYRASVVRCCIPPKQDAA